MEKKLNTDPTAIIITGMHRSGTSCLAGSLQQNGLYLGKVFEWSSYNLKGNRENELIMNLNDSVLTTSGGSWDHPPEKIVWTNEEAIKRDEIISAFVSGSEKIWGFKDPRALFTLPFWKEGIANIRLVASLRHPLLVAKSLHERATALNNGDKMTVTRGIELWESYNKSLLSLSLEENIPIISFDQSKSEYLSCIESLSRHLGLIKHASNISKSFIASSFVNQRLEDNDVQVPGEVIKLHDKLMSLSQ